MDMDIRRWLYLQLHRMCSLGFMFMELELSTFSRVASVVSITYAQCDWTFVFPALFVIILLRRSRLRFPVRHRRITSDLFV